MNSRSTNHCLIWVALIAPLTFSCACDDGEGGLPVWPYDQMGMAPTAGFTNIEVVEAIFSPSWEFERQGYETWVREGLVVESLAGENVDVDLRLLEPVGQFDIHSEEAPVYGGGRYSRTMQVSGFPAPDWYRLELPPHERLVNSNHWPRTESGGFFTEVYVGGSNPGLRSMRWRPDETEENERVLRVTLGFSEPSLLPHPRSESIVLRDSEGRRLECEDHDWIYVTYGGEVVELVPDPDDVAFSDRTFLCELRAPAEIIFERAPVSRADGTPLQFPREGEILRLDSNIPSVRSTSDDGLSGEIYFDRFAMEREALVDENAEALSPAPTKEVSGEEASGESMPGGCSTADGGRGGLVELLLGLLLVLGGLVRRRRVAAT